MDSFGFSSQIDLNGSPTYLPADIYLKIRETLDTNPPDRDWRALVRAVEKQYRIRPTTVELWAVNHSESPADKLLIELSGQGIIVTELADYLDQLKIETYHLGLRKFEEIEVLSQPGDTKEVDAGDTLFLEVEATGHPYPRYQWFFCPDGENDFERLTGRTESILRIDKVTKNNAGCYSCQIHNCGDPKKTKLTDLTLVVVNPVPASQDKEPDYWPIIENGETLVGRHQGGNDYGGLYQHSNEDSDLIVQHPADVDVEMNAPFLLEIGAQGKQPIQYQWYKDGKMMFGSSTNKIQVSHAMPDDFGEYQCFVQDAAGKTEKSRKVTVKKWPPLNPSENGGRGLSHPGNEIIFVSQPKSSMVKFGGDALFHCEAKCNAPLAYTWFKDGKPMPDQNKPEIKFVNIQDLLCAGMYQCAVYPKGGDIRSRNAMLSVPALLSIEVPPVNENIEFNPSDKVALLIGNYDYRCEESLRAPPNDVLVLSEAFRNLDFKVISLLNLTTAEIESAVLHFCKLVDRNVYAVLYFCGHGFEEDGCSFLVPTDAPHGYGIKDCVCADSILENIQENSPALVCMIIDICRRVNRCKGDGLPQHLTQRIARGNSVYFYATSIGLNAYEDSKNGLLVKHLQPLINKSLNIEQLFAELREEFSREPKHSNKQIPELRTNLLEPRRSLKDKISYQGETEQFHKRSKIWRESWIKPEKQLVPFRDIGVMIELDFQADFSNVLHVYVIVKNKGITTSCEAFLNSWPPQVSLMSKQSLPHVQCSTRKFSFADIQKLQGDMIVSVGVKYSLRNDRQDRLACLYLNLGLPLVAKLELWKPQPGFTPQSRKAIQHTEDTESLSM